MVLDPEQQKLWEEARGYAVAEILAKYRKEFAEAHSRQFSRLTQRAADGALCEDCGKNPVLEGCSVCAECGL